ncbi:FAD-binding, type 2 [Akanthomyces lecanii RCEF 1005]|uniref:FAD-binding, type 2 n=1 Tax=Akanthomyces lecanii RCEF 1005 TaxID=1081108 RepID=A0A162JNX9_CORDF|nr:FAD-binding, type 2 [Akanthomyces lecanii RCEF 1005]
MYCYKLLAVVTVLWAPTTALVLDSRAASAGPAACANLTLRLGDSKIESDPYSPSYLDTRLDYWNAQQSKYTPSCIAYPSSAKDVSEIIQAVRAAGSRFAIKAAGHNPNTFFSSVDAGVLIDLNRMTAKSYDAETTLATYEPGGDFGEIYEYFIQYHRTVVGARLSGVGTGLALGGGLSYLSPQYGMACDGFKQLEVVLPSGEIVNASRTENSDLFFACRGGGGNAYGVVTKYTVQSRPVGTFTAGNLVYLFEKNDAILQAIGNFTLYNTDPKASIIGTYERLFLPSGGLNLDSAIIMFLVYDGEDPGDVFKNFTSIPAVLNTISKKTYLEVVNMPLPVATEISRGDNIFRVAAHSISETDKTYSAAYDAWSRWCDTHKGSYELSSIDFQPIPRSLTDASATQGGNAMQMPSGPWMWLNFLITTPPGMPKANYNAVQASFRDMVASVPSAKGLPLFINDASYDQNPLSTFSSYKRLQGIKAKYDPEGFFAQYTGGWSFS